MTVPSRRAHDESVLTGAGLTGAGLTGAGPAGRRRVMVAMSGGVDSSVAAALLVAAGHDVVGVTLRLWGGDSDSGCCSVADVDDARRVAQQLDIDHHVFNMSDEFTTHVVGPYVADHAAGLTPNPCIECNRHLKFDRLLHRARALGFDSVATGHHARVVTDADGVRRIARGADAAKDQSYVLYMLDAEALCMVDLPLGDLTKDVVRSMAADLNLRTANKPDSQDVCFITSTQGRQGFLETRVELHPGRLVDTDGNEVGQVEAVELVTVGQRRGLGMSGTGAHQFAVAVDIGTRTVTVGSREQMLTDTTVCHRVQWSGEPVTGEVLAQASAHGDPKPVTVVGGSTVDGNDTIEVRWHDPVRRIAPGQSVVFYRHDLVLGGAVVT
jgi:tRNA-uridine 2-sulfurtransferase